MTAAKTPRFYDCALQLFAFYFDPKRASDPHALPDGCPKCDGDKQVCNICEEPGARCECPEYRLPTPMPCPKCDEDCVLVTKTTHYEDI